MKLLRRAVEVVGRLGFAVLRWTPQRRGPEKWTPRYTLPERRRIVTQAKMHTANAPPATGAAMFHSRELP